MKPGQVLLEGIVVRHDERRGVLVGRRAEAGELCPPGHTAHELDGVLVFLSDAQAPIPPAGLHPVARATRERKRKARK